MLQVLPTRLDWQGVEHMQTYDELVINIIYYKKQLLIVLRYR